MMPAVPGVGADHDRQPGGARPGMHELPLQLRPAQAAQQVRPGAVEGRGDRFFTVQQMGAPHYQQPAEKTDSQTGLLSRLVTLTSGDLLLRSRP